MSNDLLGSQEAYRLAILLATMIFATLVFRRSSRPGSRFSARCCS
jgi:hypothetical protein